MVSGVLCGFENCFGVSLYVHLLHPFMHIFSRFVNLLFVLLRKEILTFFSYKYKKIQSTPDNSNLQGK